MAKLISVFKILRMIFYTIAFYILYLEILYTIYILKWRKEGKTLENCVGKFFSQKQVIILCQLLLIIGVLSSPFVFSKFQNTNIGSFLEKESYQEQYYVYLRKDSNKAKSYRLKADIIRGNYGYSSWDDGNEIFVVQGNGYFLEKVYWGNGGYLTFEDELESTSARIYPGRETQVIDVHDNKYYVTLTTQKYLD